MRFTALSFAAAAFVLSQTAQATNPESLHDATTITNQ